MSAIKRWVSNVEAWTKLLQTNGKKRVMDSRKEENQLQENPVKVETLVQVDPSNIKYNDDLVMAKDKFKRLHAHKTRGLKVRAMLNWLSCGDKGSKLFLNYIKEKSCK